MAMSDDRALTVVVPLRSFDGSKSRLGPVLDPTERSELMRELAGGVVGALAGWRVVVVSDDPEVEVWAAQSGVATATPTTPGLDAAADAGRLAARAAGHRQVAIVHADLARPDALGDVLRDASSDRHRDGVTVVTDRVADGTNVLIVPTAAEFHFAYGPGSFERHRAEAERLGLTFRAIEGHELGDDVDTADDLARYRERKVEG